MAEPDTVAAIRAAVEVVAPPTDGLPGGLEVGADRHVIDLVEQSLPGLIDMAAALLNAYAGEVRADTAFADLTVSERSAVLRAMASDDSQDIRDAVDALIVFTSGGTYSEWSGYDRATGKLQPPPTWSHTGFHGPSLGHADYRENV